MIKKTIEKKKAISLRKEGNTYREILEKIPVAKSTLSLWLRDVGLAERQEQKITAKRLAAGRRGGEAKKRQRLERMKNIINFSEKEIGAISKRELWLIGITLYWAEGSKEKEYHPGSRVAFTNMDSSMVQAYLKWLFALGIKPDHMAIELIIHDSHKNRISEIVKYWTEITGFSKSFFTRIYFKRGNIKTKRRNISESYYGTIKIKIKRSSELLRRITGWTRGIYKGINKRNWGIV